jgi:hypothetical protein
MTIPLRLVPRITSGSVPATCKGAEIKIHPRTLIEFTQLYPTEEGCRLAVFGELSPYSLLCRRCGHKRAWYLRDRGLYACATYHCKTSLPAGTILSCTRTDLHAPRTCRRTSTSSPAGPIAGTSARISSGTSSTAACAPQRQRPMRCPRLPERWGWAWRSSI